MLDSNKQLANYWRARPSLLKYWRGTGSSPPPPVSTTMSMLSATTTHLLSIAVSNYNRKIFKHWLRAGLVQLDNILWSCSSLYHRRGISLHNE